MNYGNQSYPPYEQKLPSPPNQNKFAKEALEVLITFALGCLANFASNLFIPGFAGPGSLFPVILSAVLIPVALIIQFQQENDASVARYIYGFIVGFLQNLIVAAIPNTVVPTLGKISLYIFVGLVVLGPPIANLIGGRDPFRPSLFRNIVAAASGAVFLMVTSLSYAAFLYYQFLLPSRTANGSFNIPPQTNFWLYAITFAVFILLPYITGAIVCYLSVERKSAIILCALGVVLLSILIYSMKLAPFLGDYAACFPAPFFPLMLLMFWGRYDAKNTLGFVWLVYAIWRFIRYDLF